MPSPIVRSRFHTDKSWNQTIAELKEVFDLWGIVGSEWGAKALQPGNGAEVWYYLPYDRDRKSISCLSQDDSSTNLRACYMVAVELQRASVRGIRIASGGSELLALPAGSGSPGVPPSAARPGQAVRKTRFRDMREACAALGIALDASQEDAEDMYRIKARRYHPDNKETGNEEQFKKVNEAWEIIRARRGWAEAA